MTSRIFHSIGILLSLIAFVTLVGVPLDLRSQCVFAGSLFLASLLIRRLRSERSVFVLMLITLVISTRYLWWRATYTLDFTDAWSAAAGYALFAAELYAFIVLILGYLQSVRPLKRKPAPLPSDTSLWPTVDVFIPTYNEPLHVVAATVAGSLNLEWPRDKLTIYLLDDGNRPEFRRYAADVGVTYRARQSNVGAKAGNLNEALKYSKGELIAVFDSDQVPVRSFLQMTAGWFLKDRKIAQLQTPQYFYTPDPIEKSLAIDGKVPNESSLFYGLIQDGNDLWNATYFCGSCAVLRRSALLEIGGIAEDTVTEDAHTAIKLHRRGYDSAYINEVQSAGMATDSLAAHVNQRIRWARGLVQLFRIDNPLLGRGLTLWQRLCYANATMHFFYATPRLIFLLAPLCFLFFDLSVIQADAALVAAMALPHILQNNLTAARMSGHWRHAFWAEIYETVLSFYIFIPTMVALIFPKRGKFNVTQKGHSNDITYFNYKLARPFIVIGLLNVAAISVGLYRYLVLHSAEPSTTALNLFWASYNVIITGAAIAVALEKRQTRMFQRHSVSISAILSTRSGRRVSAMTRDLSESGASLVLDKSYPAPTGGADENFVRLTLAGEFGLVSLPVENSVQVGELLRVELAELDHRTHRNLVKLLYSSADRWVGVREQFRPASLLRSIGTVVYTGLLGWVRVFTGMARSSARLPEQTFASNKQALPFMCSLIVSGAFVMGLLHARPVIAQEMMVYELRQLTDRLDVETDLGSVHYGLEIPFAIRRDTVVNSGEINLSMSWSDGDKSREESIVISVNNRTLWRSTQKQGSNEAVSIPFDGSLLTDYNTLKIALENPDTEQCETRSSESFSLTLHEGSEIQMDVSTIPIANDLDTLPLPFFDERDPRRATIDFVLPVSSSEEALIAAGRVAAWFGSLASYRSVEYRVSAGQLPDKNAVVVASADNLPDGLAWLDAGEPRVLLMDSPDFPERQLLVVTSPSDSQLHMAVDRLLATTDHLSENTVSGNLPDRSLVGIDHPVQFSHLGSVDSDSLSIVNNNFSPIRIPFQVPGDFHPGDGKPHLLTLNYRYSPNFPGYNEKMFVSLNGKGLLELDLEEQNKPDLFDVLTRSGIPDSAFGGNVVIRVPHEFINHDNRLEVRFTAPPSVTDNCGGAYATLVDAGIGGDSTLDISNGALRARYPDLALFVNSGLPFTERLDLSTTHIQLPEQAKAHHYALFLSLMGRFAAITGSEPANVSVSQGLQETSVRNHQIVIGDSGNTLSLNQALSSSPLYFARDGLAADFGRPWSLYEALSDWVNPVAVGKQLEKLRQSHDAASDAYIVSARMPGQSSGVMLALLSENELTTDDLQSVLTDPVKLGQVQGSAAVIAQGRTESIRVGRDVTHGHLPLLQSLWWWLRENLIVMLLLVGLSALLFSVSLSGILDRVALRRLEDQRS